MHKSLLDLCSLIRVQTWDVQAVVPPQVEQTLGVAWPRRTGAEANGGADIICVGPTDWLVIAGAPDRGTAQDRSAVALLEQLDEAFAGSAFRATNVSQALARVQVEGSKARDLLAKGCALDLHPAHFARGRSARTRFAGMPVIVRCTGDSTFECIITQSYADFFLSWLADAALEFELTP